MQVAFRSRGTGRSFSTAVDPTKRAAPGRRSPCDVTVSRACDHSWKVSRDGGPAASRFKRFKEAAYSLLDLWTARDSTRCQSLGPRSAGRSLATLRTVEEASNVDRPER
jgi:hypothetical protein